MDSLEIVVCGLSITSTRHNTHAGTWRNLLRAMAGRGHRITFLERDQARFDGHRDLTSTPYCEIHLYRDLEELRDRFGGAVARADMVMVGSGVPQGAAVSQWVLDTSRGIRAFYDLDAPGATEEILAGNSAWLAPERLRDFDLFLTSTGGLLLGQVERKLGVRLARPLYPSADPVEHVRPAVATQYDLGHLAPYCSRRFRSVTELLLESAQGWEGGRFVLAGPEYPGNLRLPTNVQRRAYVPQEQRDHFLALQRFTLHATAPAVSRMGYCPTPLLFEAAALGTPVITDRWNGISRFFQPDEEILVCRSPREVLEVLRLMPEARRLALRQRARKRVRAEHTPDHRAETLESWVEEVARTRSGSRTRALSRV